MSPAPLIRFLTLAAALLTPVVRGEHHERHWFLLSIYHLRSAESAAVFDRAAGEALLPALARRGIGPVGVFRPTWLEGDDADREAGAAHRRYLVVPVDSVDALPALREELATDPAFLEGAREYLQESGDEPLYTRVETSLLHGFTGMPKLVVPPKETAGPRLFELRIYESRNEDRARMKVAMFNDGELEIFRKVDLQAVFFGEAYAAANLPNLTYMLVYDDEKHRARAWKDFLAHPDWDRLKNDEKYRDTVSKIISQHLLPTDASGIQ